MKRCLCLCLFLTSLNAYSSEAVEYFERIEKMVQSGAITPAAALEEKRYVEARQKKRDLQRGLAQRELASVDPALKPLTTVRFKAPPLFLKLD